ncbi:hypothetical protein DACRYDRAFT_107131 [Dacryopinax primogenitus]|uniref:Uncharacterized protein n=1 Tax=Dacryopinax primogenitus (strain DJM 731) TaxID=1858805 RepID=M5G0D9_DACPD|nr:uncharacterized protein DACRYDRAFT_107131 [Dacryopinax primogenitus]EJU02194.1 hypothetical protein DACRYDRAFT_107131 [Dacryopinax primogenitus]
MAAGPLSHAHSEPPSHEPSLNPAGVPVDDNAPEHASPSSNHKESDSAISSHLLLSSSFSGM